MRGWLVRHRRQLVLFGPVGGVFCAAVLALLAAIFILSRGKLIYALDDAYSHLALAENIARGHYGVNLAEASAPSSSILWPFLLAPLAASAVGPVIPLLINLVAALGTLAVFAKLCLLVFAGCEPPGRDAPAAALILLIPATNLIALIFTGMEHSLQLFLTAAALLGMIKEARSGQVRWWLVAALVLGPLGRYENLAVSSPALLYLVLRGRIKPALGAGGVLGAALIAYSRFLRSLGLYPLPTSVIAKSWFVQFGGVWKPLALNVYQNLTDAQGGLLALGLLLLLASVLFNRRRAERLLAGCASLSVALHLLLGGPGSARRYEAYLWAFALLALGYLYRHALRLWVERSRPAPTLLAGAGFTLVIARLYLLLTVISPIGAHSIYRQQYQMHRFAADYYRAPVAVNDIGLVSYRNDHYVLDLAGPSSIAALRGLSTSTDAAWMEDLARQHDVRLIMLYDAWFPYGLPVAWVPIGRLILSEPAYGVAYPVVGFYAVGDDAARQVKPLLMRFRQTLPPGVRFQFAGED